MKLQFILFVFACAATETWACHSCGISHGGPMVQVVESKKFKWLEGLEWYPEHDAIVFVDRLNHSLNNYYPNNGKASIIIIEEFKNQELAAVYPIHQDDVSKVHGKLKYVIAANQSLYKFEKEFGEPYKLEKIMDITDESHYFSKAAIDKKGNIVIGTYSTDFSVGQNTEDFDKESGQYYYVNVAGKSKKLIEKGLAIAGGVCFNKYYDKLYSVDPHTNKMHSYHYNIEDGTLSDKKEILDLSEYNKTKSAGVHGEMASIVMDTEDNIWIALFNSHEVLVFSPHKGIIIKRVGVSEPIQSALAWGGPEYDILFVGTAEGPHSGYGSLMAISNTGHRGWMSFEVKI